MNTVFRCLAILLILMSTYSAYADEVTPNQGIYKKTPTLIVLHNATVLVSPTKILTNAAIYIKNGRIQKVSTDQELLAGYWPIDLTGHSIYAGFIDPYTQYGIPQAASASEENETPVYERWRLGGEHYNAAIRPELEWVHSFEPDQSEAKAFRLNGFTTVQTAQWDGLLRGQSAIVATGEGQPSDLILKAYSQHFFSFNKGSSPQDNPNSLMGSIALIRQTLTDAQWYQQAQNKSDQRFLTTPLAFSSSLATLADLSAGILFATDDDRSLVRAAKLLAEFDLQATLMGSGYEYTRLQTIKALMSPLVLPLNFPVTPTIHSAHSALSIPLTELRHWDLAVTNLAQVAKADIPFALTHNQLSDKEKFWPQLRRAIQAGLSEADALTALTITPAKLLKIDDQVGQIKPGFLADLVITTGNIFAEGEIVAVVNQGHIYELTQQLNQRYAHHYEFSSQQKEYELTLTKKKKWQGELTTEGLSLSLEHITANEQQVTFTITHQEQAHFFSLVLTNDQITLSSPSFFGSFAQFALNKRPVSLEQTAEKKEEPLSYSPIAKLTYPNLIYGLTQLPQAEALHIKHATVWTADRQGILEDTDVLVEEGVFKKIGKNLSTPRGYRVIDAQGKHITPGIIDEHSHIAIFGGVNEASYASSADVRIRDVINPDDIGIYRGLAGGVTTAHLLHGSANPIGGQSQVIKLRWGEVADRLIFNEAPDTIKLALGENVKQSNWGDNYKSRYPQTRMGVGSYLRDQFQQAIEYQQQQQEYAKLSRRKKKSIIPPRINYRTQALVDILAGERHIHIHSYVQSEILNMLQIANDMGFKVQTFTHVLEGYKAAKELAAHGAGASTFSDWWAYKFEVYDAIPSNTCLMQQQGVVVSVNSDSHDLQRRLNQQAAKSMTYCGMTPEEAIKLVTINPAKQLLVDEYVGSITVDKQADFVIWDHNPLSIYAKAEQTWVDGKLYYSQAQEQQSAQAVHAEKQALITKILAEPYAKEKTGIQHTPKLMQQIWHCDDRHNSTDIQQAFLR